MMKGTSGFSLAALLTSVPCAFTAKSGNRQFEGAPCVWMTGAEGEVRLNGKTVDFARPPHP